MFVLEIVAAAILAFLPPQDRENPFWRRLRVSAGLALAFYVLWYVAKVSGLTELLFSVQFDRAGRLVNVEMGGTWIRLGLWKAAADMVWENPWLGIGINNYDWFAFDQMKYFPAMEKTGSIVVGDAEHAHNLIMHLAAEMGIVAGVIVSVWLVRWSVRAFSSRTRGEDWWVVACGSVILIHAMLEYPLWYSYYLGLFCLLAGWRSTIWSVPRQATRRIGAAMSVVSFLGLGLLAFTASQYLAFERMVNIGPIFGGEASAVRRSAERLMTNLKNESLLSGKATYGLAFNFTLNTINVREKAEICRRAIRWEPDRAIVFRCAVLFALEGRRDEALALMDRSVLAFPSEALTVSAQLSQMAQQAPQLRPLAFELDMLIARRQRQYPQVWTPELGPSTIPIL